MCIHGLTEMGKAKSSPRRGLDLLIPQRMSYDNLRIIPFGSKTIFDSILSVHSLETYRETYQRAVSLPKKHKVSIFCSKNCVISILKDISICESLYFVNILQNRDFRQMSMRRICEIMALMRWQDYQRPLPQPIAGRSKIHAGHTGAGEQARIE